MIALKIPRKISERKWLSSLVLGTIFGVVIFAGIIVWAGLDSIWQQRRVIGFRYLWAYVGLAIVTYVFRAWRFRLLLGIKGSITKLYGIVSVHTLMLNLLPFSSGEISYPLLLKRYGVSNRFLEGVSSIVMARLQDGFIYISFLLLALVWAGDLGPVIQWATEKFSVATLLSTLTLGIGVFLLYRRLGKKLLVVRHLKRVLPEILSSFKETSPMTWVTSFLTAFIARLASIIAVFFLFEALGIELPFPTVFLITSLYVFLPYLPVNTPAGVGITEAFLMSFFIHNGIDRGVAAAASIQIHFLQLMVSAILGALGLLQLQCLRKRDHRTACQ